MELPLNDVRNTMIEGLVWVNGCWGQGFRVQFYIVCNFFFFFFGTGAGTQGLTLARQARYHLSPSASFFIFIYSFIDMCIH
jgi:hypothetical protein